jgi:hypothetical protein
LNVHMHASFDASKFTCNVERARVCSDLRFQYGLQVDIVTDDYNNEVIMVGNYYNYFGFELYRDIFDLVAAGRPSAVGCAVSFTVIRVMSM